MGPGIGAGEGRSEARIIAEAAVIAGLPEHERQAYMLCDERVVTGADERGGDAAATMRRHDCDGSERDGGDWRAVRINCHGAEQDVPDERVIFPSPKANERIALQMQCADKIRLTVMTIG